MLSVVIAVVAFLVSLVSAVVTWWAADELCQSATKLAEAVVDLESRLQDLAEQTGRLNELHLRSDLNSNSVDRHAATIDANAASLADLMRRFNILDHYVALRDFRTGPILARNMAAAARNQPVGQLQGMTVDGVQVEPPPDSVSIVSNMRDEWSERTDRLADQIRKATDRFSVANHVKAVERQAERNRVRAAAEEAERAHLEDELAALRTEKP